MEAAGAAGASGASGSGAPGAAKRGRAVNPDSGAAVLYVGGPPSAGARCAICFEVMQQVRVRGCVALTLKQNAR
jgi:hypothetical protein